MPKQYITNLLIVLSICSLALISSYNLSADSLSSNLSAKNIIANMTLEEKCAQVIMIGIQGNSLTSKNNQLLSKIPVGAIIFFRYNVSGGAEQIYNFTSQLQDLAGSSGAKIPLFIAIDHEGGGVQRLKEQVTILPSAKRIGKANKPKLTEQLGEAIGEQLLALGINMNLAPVLEKRNKIMISRTYSEDPKIVAQIGASFISGLQKANVIATAKHFPATGMSDPHKAIASISGDEESIIENYLISFQYAMQLTNLEAIMTSHIILSDIDADYPVPLSNKAIEGLLYNKLKFNGLTVSDDLRTSAKGGMALAHNFPTEEAAVLAMNAGVDLLMLSDSALTEKVHQSLIEAVKEGTIAEQRLDEAVMKIIDLKIRYGIYEQLKPSIRETNYNQLNKATEKGNELVKLIVDS